MSIEVLFFGRLVEIAGNSITVAGVQSTDELLQRLEQDYPKLSTEKYIVALNKNMIDSNMPLTAGSTVALLPPYSGG
ncbi:MAG: MoaD/ThiS family protein [Chitinophagaceae bacterium]|nr:MAG: MoaD/ThiS family protein [Chitinophagaceae bacterium]